MSDGPLRDDGDLDNQNPLEIETPDAVTSPATISNIVDLYQDRQDIVRDESGAPILAANGLPRKKPGRKPKGLEPAGATPATPATPTAAPSPLERKAQRVASTELARSILATSVGAMMTLVGPEWDFRDQQEADGMKAAVASYIDAKGGGQVTPEMMLILVVGGYTLPRLAEENTRSKFSQFFGWVKNGLRAIFSR